MTSIVANLQVADMCTPVKFDLICNPNNSSNFSLTLSSDPIVLDRGGIEYIGDISICIQKPIYFGCVKIPEFELRDLSSVSFDMILQDIQNDGTLGNTATPDIQSVWELTQTKHQICIKTTARNNSSASFFLQGKASICDFTGCKMLLSFDNDATPMTINSDAGFSLCTVPTECNLLCGHVQVCSANPYEITAPQQIDLGSFQNTATQGINELFVTPPVSFNNTPISQAPYDGSSIWPYTVTGPIEFNQITGIWDPAGFPLGSGSFELTVCETKCGLKNCLVVRYVYEIVA